MGEGEGGNGGEVDGRLNRGSRDSRRVRRCGAGGGGGGSNSVCSLDPVDGVDVILVARNSQGGGGKGEREEGGVDVHLGELAAYRGSTSKQEREGAREKREKAKGGPVLAGRSTSTIGRKGFVHRQRRAPLLSFVRVAIDVPLGRVLCEVLAKIGRRKKYRRRGRSRRASRSTTRSLLLYTLANVLG